MRSYIKIYGPPILKAIKELEKLAIDMPEVSVMDHFIQRDLSPKVAKEIGGSAVNPLNAPISGFFMERTGVVVSVERSQSIISKHGQKLGEFDFFFEWRKDPKTSQLDELIRRIDVALKPLGCLYTITTK